jgi:hypothetical protein
MSMRDLLEQRKVRAGDLAGIDSSRMSVRDLAG